VDVVDVDDRGVQHRARGEWHFARILEGSRPDGTAIRWSFTDIRPESCTWRGEASSDGGKTWHPEAEFRMRRVTL
jgi:hypothetical protein